MAEIDIVMFDPTQFYTSVNPYWIPVRAGVLLASQMQGVNIRYHTPSCTGEYNYSNIYSDMHNILKAISQKSSNGVIITLPDFHSHKDMLQEIMDKGIPVVYLLAPKDVEPRAIANIGSNMFKEGMVGLQRLNIGASDKVIILRNYKKGESDLYNQRDIGVQAYLQEHGIDPNSIIDLFLNVSDKAQSIQQVIKTLEKTGANTVLSYNVQLSGAFVGALEVLSREQRPIPDKSCCFDLTQDVLKGIDDGLITCAVDRQPFLMGYFSVTLLSLYLAHGIVPPSIYTGPHIIDQKNIKKTMLHFCQKR